MDHGTTPPGAVSEAELLAAIAAVFGEDEQVPDDAVQAAIATFTWRSVDAELLDLLFDSLRDVAEATRTKESPTRLLTFTSPTLTVEIELAGEISWIVRGALSPADSYRVELHQGSDRIAGESTEAGLFELRTTDSRPVRLVITTDAEGGRIMTPWIDLVPDRAVE